MQAKSVWQEPQAPAPRREPARDGHRLAASLIAYVSDDDVQLPRDQFLRRVINRIVDDLSALLPPT